MLTHRDLPRALRELVARENADTAAILPRRTFLKVAGFGSFALGLFWETADAQAANASSGVQILKPGQQPAAFVEIASSGDVTITVNRLDVGQGVHTALPMLLAEELDADWAKVRSGQSTNDPAYVDPLFGIHMTGGSTSVKHSFQHYRELGARTRLMLMAAAAKRWKTVVSTLSTQAGVVHGPGGRKLSYGELAKEGFAMPVPQNVQLKNPREFRIIGQPTTRLDAAAKSSGRQVFGIDVRLPGQLIAVIARPPVFGARLASMDDAAARTKRGIRAVLRVPLDRGAEGVAIVADGYWPAHQAREALKLQWDMSKVEKVDSMRLLARYRELAATPGAIFFDADMSPLARAPQRIDAEITFPYLAHAAMEPLSCTVKLAQNGVELWVGAQNPGLDAAAAARVLGLKPEQVRVYLQMSGGSFGRRGELSSDFVVDACQVAKAARAAGIEAPISTRWSREDDMRNGYYRPMHVHRARIGFDASGRILAWDHVIVGQSIVTGTFFEQMLVKNGVDITAVEGMRRPYPLPMRLSAHHPKVNVPVTSWRSVGSTHTAFAMETLIDEVARATRQDPVAYRLALLGDQYPRHRAALQLAVEKSGYGKRSLPAGRAWGVAMHESFDSVVAYVVEASIRDGQPVLHRATAGVHCNMVVNPRTLETQVQGGALMGLSMCLPRAAITLADGVVEQRNFGEFSPPRIGDMPPIDVHAVPSADPPTGIGEPGLPPLAPAFANAIARITGKPVRQLPFKI
jgi:isoquinoline 1-oxidoreductase beta subunit